MTEQDLKLYRKGLARCVTCNSNLPIKAYHPAVQAQLPARSPRTVRCRTCDTARIMKRYREDEKFREGVKKRNRAHYKAKR